MGKIHVKRGDQVKILHGEDRGKTGKILEVNPKKGQVYVDGMNVQKRHARPTRTNPQGGVVEGPGPIDSSNVALVCPSCNKASRYRRERSASGVTRVCRRCEKAID